MRCYGPRTDPMPVYGKWFETIRYLFSVIVQLMVVFRNTVHSW